MEKTLRKVVEMFNFDVGHYSNICFTKKLKATCKDYDRYFYKCVFLIDEDVLKVYEEKDEIMVNTIIPLTKIESIEFNKEIKFTKLGA